MNSTFAPTSARVRWTRRSSVFAAMALTVAVAGAAVASSTFATRGESAGAKGFTGTEAVIKAEIADRYPHAAPRDIEVFIGGEVSDRYRPSSGSLRDIDVFVSGEVADRYGPAGDGVRDIDVFVSGEVADRYDR